MEMLEVNYKDFEPYSDWIFNQGKMEIVKNNNERLIRDMDNDVIMAKITLTEDNLFTRVNEIMFQKYLSEATGRKL